MLFTPLHIAFLILAAGACGGLLFTTLLVLKRRYPRWFGAGHGLLGLAGVCVLAYALSQLPDPVNPLAWWALGVLVAALLGGFTLFRVLMPKGRSVLLALGHGALALIGLYLLYQVAF